MSKLIQFKASNGEEIILSEDSIKRIEGNRVVIIHAGGEVDSVTVSEDTVKSIITQVNTAETSIASWLPTITIILVLAFEIFGKY